MVRRGRRFESVRGLRRSACYFVEDIATIDALDEGANGRVGPNPDTYEGT
jgi:hypothetical protein